MPPVREADGADDLVPRAVAEEAATSRAADAAEPPIAPRHQAQQRTQRRVQSMGPRIEPDRDPASHVDQQRDRPIPLRPRVGTLPYRQITREFEGWMRLGCPFVASSLHARCR